MQQFNSFPTTSGVLLVRDRHNVLLLAMPAVNIRQRAKAVITEHRDGNYGSSYRIERVTVLKAQQTLFLDYIETPNLDDTDRKKLATTIDDQSLSHNL